MITTPQPGIARTAIPEGRQHVAPKLNPPKFAEDLRSFAPTPHLKNMLEELSKEDRAK